MVWLAQGAQLLSTQTITAHGQFVYQGYIDIPPGVFNHRGRFCYHAAFRSVGARVDNDSAGFLQERTLIAGMRHQVALLGDQSYWREW
jgi:hypothetical protein